MRLSATRPVTILSDRVDRRYIPQMAILPNGVYRLNIGVGPDNAFTPGYAYHSYDKGRTWQEGPQTCPRIETMVTFSDGSYYDIDDYFFQDADDKAYYVGWAGFCADGQNFEKRVVKFHSPSCQPVTLRSMREMGQPQFPWFDMINLANHDRPASLDNIFVGGSHVTAIIELDSPKHLLASGFWRSNKGHNKRVVTIFESHDGGELWEEISTGMAEEDSPQGPNETAMIKLESGEIYLMARTGGLMLEARSNDDGKTWSDPKPIKLADSGKYLTGVMPIIRHMRNGGLICVFGRPKGFFDSLEDAAAFDFDEEHYGQPGKLVMVDPTGTATQWQSLLDLHPLEVEHQQQMGVPPEECIRVEEDGNVRERNSWEYLTLNEVEDDQFLVAYDVQQFRESWNGHPFNGVRMVRVSVHRD